MTLQNSAQIPRMLTVLTAIGETCHIRRQRVELVTTFYVIRVRS